MNLKRIFFSLFPFFFFILLAVNADSQAFYGGFYGGASMTNVGGINNESGIHHIGVIVAGTVGTKISPSTKLQMEIRFNEKGASQSPVIDSVAPTYSNNQSTQAYNTYYDLTLYYVDVVIGIKHQIHFSIQKTPTDRYGIEAGVSLGTLVSYSYSVESITYNNLNLSLLDVSPYIGLYYNITPHFYIEGRYNNSVNSIIKHDAPSNQYFLYYDSWNAGHNLGFSLTLGFAFGGSGQPSDISPIPAPAPAK